MRRRWYSGRYVQRTSTNTLLVATAWFAGCTADSGPQTKHEHEATLCEKRILVPTSLGCQAWRETTCALRAADQTQSCLEQLAAIACRSEELAQQCAAAIAEASCEDSYPMACSLKGVAETTLAIQSCGEYMAAVCQSAVRCGLEKSVDECMLGSELQCNQALGVRDDFARCLSEVAVLSCSAWVPPRACLGVVVVLE